MARKQRDLFEPEDIEVTPSAADVTPPVTAEFAAASERY